MSISVLGGGAFGTALASMLATGKDDVTLWARDTNTIDQINQRHRNPDYLGEIALPRNLTATNELALACRANTILCVTPAQSFADLASAIKPHLAATSTLVLCAKGIDPTSGMLLHQLATDGFGIERVSCLSGPSFATDVAQGLPTAVSLAASNLSQAKEIATHLARPTFRIYGTDDLVGVEIGGALKNVLALAVGIARGLHLGASAEAALTTRGFAELNRVALAMGARAETLAGLSGLGDLVLSCSSPQSRNFSYGIALAQNEDLENRPLAEGVHSANTALKLARAHNVDTPIIEMVVRVLEKEVQPHEAVKLLLARPLRNEL